MTKTDTTQTTRGKFLKGVVVKAAMQDTVTVSVQRYVKHAKYKKYLTLEKSYLVHNPGGIAKKDDVVIIRSTRPISKRKHFIIESVVFSAQETE